MVEVADEQLVDAASSLSDIFGPIDVRVAEHPVAGIDVIVHLGTDYLATPQHGRGDVDRRRCRLGSGGQRGYGRGRWDGMTDLSAGDLAIAAARCADEKQGRNIVILEVSGVLAITEFFVVIDAPNRRLVRTLVEEVEERLRELTGRSPLRVEGLREQQWVLMDYGDIVVHVFLDEIRRFYEIERLYRDVARLDWAVDA